MAMNNPLRGIDSAKKVDGFLDIACKAEAEKDIEEAERLFELAVRCEARNRPEVINIQAYLDAVGRVYAEPGADSQKIGRSSPG